MVIEWTSSDACIWTLHPAFATTLFSSLNYQVYKAFLEDLEWGTPQVLVGQDDEIQPCAVPGCEPFPYCCRTDQLSQDQTLAWL